MLFLSVFRIFIPLFLLSFFLTAVAFQPGSAPASASAVSPAELQAQPADEEGLRIARIKYRGGGDWYNDPSALSNLIAFTRNEIPISLSRQYDDVDIGSRRIHEYPFAFLTGHGNLVINQTEASNLRDYVDNGGFLYIDDDYGFDSYVRTLIAETFPDDTLIELPANHPIYNQVFSFGNGLPKIHEHDGEAPRGYGIFRDGRLAVYYTHETNLADGWAYDVHDNPEEKRLAALRMGVNLLVYAFTSER